jgi:hypothetical protein
MFPAQSCPMLRMIPCNLVEFDRNVAESLALGVVRVQGILCTYPNSPVPVDISHEPLQFVRPEPEGMNPIGLSIVLVKRGVSADPDFAGSVLEQGISRHAWNE